MSKEYRKLTRAEFYDLVSHAKDDREFLLDLLQTDLFEFFSEHDMEGFLIDGVPIYCGCINSDHFTYTIMRDGVKEKYPFTLYKMVKDSTRRYADKLGDVKCKITSNCGEANLIKRWIKQIGYEPVGDDVYILKGN